MEGPGSWLGGALAVRQEEPRELVRDPRGVDNHREAGTEIPKREERGTLRGDSRQAGAKEVQGEVNHGSGDQR
jgi:hypothetical protein